MIGLCLASGVLTAFIATQEFTLRWTHSIEKVRWEENWQVRIDDARTPVLRLVEGRIRGSGAGMEPPDGARLIDGVWHYPVGHDMAEVELAHSHYTAGYELCLPAGCRPLADYLPGLSPAPEHGTSIRLYACRAPLQEPDAQQDTRRPGAP
jgi:hypothetical protein